MTVATTDAGVLSEFEPHAAQWRPGLLRTAWLLTGQTASAEDLVQTTLETTWRQWDRVRGMDFPEAYVRRTMTNAFISSRRRRWVGEHPTETLPEVAGTDDHRRAEQRLVLTRALDRLAPRQRAVVVLRYFDDLSEADAAAALDCSTGTVKSQLHKALRTLRADASLTDLLQEF